MVLLAQKEIKTLEQLKGKRHAISRFGSIADLGSRLILQRFGLVPTKTLPFSKLAGPVLAWRHLTKRTVDSTIFTPEFFLVAKKAGFTILVDPTQYQIRFPATGSHNDSLISSKPSPILRRDTYGRSLKGSTFSSTIVKRAFGP